MDNSGTLATFSTQETGRRQTIKTTQKTKKITNKEHTYNRGWTQVLVKVKQVPVSVKTSAILLI